MCRDGDDAGGGGAALRVAEPQVRGRLHEEEQLRARVPDGGLPLRRVQAPRRHPAQVLLHQGLLAGEARRGDSRVQQRPGVSSAPRAAAMRWCI